jgi:hypothetical protein
MPEPFAQPLPGSKPKLYRLVRDTAYHVSGTILALKPEQVSPLHHELVEVPSDKTDILATLDALTARAAALETARAAPDLTDRVVALETREMPPDLSAPMAALTEKVSSLEQKFVPVVTEEPPKDETHDT